MTSFVLPGGFPFDDPDLPYVITLMQASDLRQVMAIERRAFSSPWPVSAYHHELSQNDLSTYLVLRHRDGREESGVWSRLVGGGGTPVLGYGGFWMIVDEAHISTLAVHPEWRGRGLGELILVALIEAARLRGADVATLEVRVSNLVAQALYRKHDFARVGRRKAYYNDNREDAFIMTTPSLGDRRYAARYAARKERLRERLV
jgi:ribosomal-protein-alanine N-acetyltransferase